MTIYTDSFYKSQVNPSYLSAIEYSRILRSIVDINSIIDIGCGRGSWLKAFKEVFSLETQSILGIDGNWNSKNDLILDCNYMSFDLEKVDQLQLDNHYDLAISLEVAEHIPSSVSKDFVSALCNNANLIIFSSANSLQGGIGHINESRPSYWANLFFEHDYLAFDVFRPKLWGNPNVKWWYQQNTFLYAKKNSSFHKKIEAQSYEPLQNYSLMDSVHPDIFQQRSRFWFLEI